MASSSPLPRITKVAQQDFTPLLPLLLRVSVVVLCGRLRLVFIVPNGFVSWGWMEDEVHHVFSLLWRDGVLLRMSCALHV